MVNPMASPLEVVGDDVGSADGPLVGTAVGALGLAEGWKVIVGAPLVGAVDGESDGIAVGSVVGDDVGSADGPLVGTAVGALGLAEGWKVIVGAPLVGAVDGESD